MKKRFVLLLILFLNVPTLFSAPLQMSAIYHEDIPSHRTITANINEATYPSFITLQHHDYGRRFTRFTAHPITIAEHRIHRHARRHMEETPHVYANIFRDYPLIEVFEQAPILLHLIDPLLFAAFAGQMLLNMFGPIETIHLAVDGELTLVDFMWEATFRLNLGLFRLIQGLTRYEETPLGEALGINLALLPTYGLTFDPRDPTELMFAVREGRWPRPARIIRQENLFIRALDTGLEDIRYALVQQFTGFDEFVPDQTYRLVTRYHANAVRYLYVIMFEDATINDDNMNIHELVYHIILNLYRMVDGTPIIRDNAPFLMRNLDRLTAILIRLARREPSGGSCLLL